MKILGIEINRATPKQPDAGIQLSPEQYRLYNHLVGRMNNKSVEKAVIELVEQTKYLTKQDVGKWRQAWQRAISVEWPSRFDLHAVYRDVEIDNHLTGVIGQIKKEVLQKEVVIVDRMDNSKEIPELRPYIDDAQWFIDFCEYVIDAEFWGFSLIEFGNAIDVNGIKKFDGVDIIDRDHVVPEHDVFLKHFSDNYKNGINYTEPPYSNWVLPVGKKKNLGLYNKLAPHALAKKNMLAFWDKFGEIFGMPIRIGKTSTSNAKDRNDVSDMLKNMGAAAWGLFPDGTDIEIKETTRGDSWQVYDKRIERANSEMSKCVVHQTMTTDNGSSKSQSETHLTIQEFVVEYFARLVRIAINDKLIPFMIMHGFKGWENAKVKFDDTEEYTVDEQVKILDLLMNHYDVDIKYIEENFNVPITAKKQAAHPQPPMNRFFD